MLLFMLKLEGFIHFPHLFHNTSFHHCFMDLRYMCNFLWETNDLYGHIFLDINNVSIWIVSSTSHLKLRHSTHSFMLYLISTPIISCATLRHDLAAMYPHNDHTRVTHASPHRRKWTAWDFRAHPKLQNRRWCLVARGGDWPG